MIKIMSKLSALVLLKKSDKILFIEHWFDKNFIAMFKYDETASKMIRENIASAKYIPDKRGYKFHYLDLRDLVNLFETLEYEIIIEEEAQQKMLKIKEEYTDILQWKSKQIINMPPLKKQLKPFQIIGAQYMYRTQKVLNADSMGLGKTLQSIAAILINKYNGNPYRTLIICPTSVKFNWYYEIKEATDELNPLILSSKTSERFTQYEQEMDKYDVFIASFDSMVRDYKYEVITTYINPNIIIIDEAHRLANKANKITQLFIGGRNIRKPLLPNLKAHSIYLLTGSPIINKLDDLYSLFKILDVGLFEYAAFKNKYLRIREFEKVITNEYGIPKRLRVPIIYGYKNGDDLKKRIIYNSIRRTKDEISNELPPITYKTYTLEFSEQEQAIYNKLRQDFLMDVKKTPMDTFNALKWFTKAQQLCDSLELIPELNLKISTKLDALKEIINDHPDCKIVVFTKFKKMVDILASHLRKHKPIVFHGELKEEERHLALSEFKNNPERKIFLATLGAGGVGINLTTGEQFDIIVVMYDRWYSAVLNTQAISRSFRIGQNKPVHVIILKMKDTIEEKIEKIWTNKELMTIDIIDEDTAFKKLTIDQLIELI